jgi:hypothetical protein
MRKTNQGHKDLKRLKSRTEAAELSSLADFEDAAVLAHAISDNTHNKTPIKSSGPMQNQMKDLISNGIGPKSSFNISVSAQKISFFNPPTTSHFQLPNGSPPNT